MHPCLQGVANWKEQYTDDDELPEVVVTVKHESPVKSLKEVAVPVSPTEPDGIPSARLEPAAAAEEEAGIQAAGDKAAAAEEGKVGLAGGEAAGLGSPRMS